MTDRVRKGVGSLPEVLTENHPSEAVAQARRAYDRTVAERLEAEQGGADPISRQRILKNFALQQRSKVLQRMRDDPKWLSIIEDDEGTVTRLLLGNKDWQEDRAAELIKEGHRNIETQRRNDPTFNQRMEQGDIDFVEAMSSYYPKDPSEAPDPTAARLLDVGSTPLNTLGAYLPKDNRPMLMTDYRTPESYQDNPWVFDVAEPGAAHVYVESSGKDARLSFDPTDTRSQILLPGVFAHEFEHKRHDRGSSEKSLDIASSDLPNTGFIATEQFTRLRDLLRAPTEDSLLIHLEKNTSDSSSFMYQASEELNDVLYDIQRDILGRYPPDRLAQKKKETVSKLKLLLKALNLPTSKAGWKDKSTVHVSEFVLNLLDD